MAAAVIGAYLLGSIDFGVVVPRLFGIDIYTVGSGNPGASNVLRTMGRAAAAAVMVGDIAKGVGAAAAGELAGGVSAGFAVGLAAVVGHCFPIWHRLRGGKGVATMGGMTLWLEPLLGVAMMVAWGVLAVLTRRASVASLVVVAAYPPLLMLLGHGGWSLLWAAAVAVLVIARHHDNIRRLVTGSEYRIEEKAP